MQTGNSSWLHPPTEIWYNNSGNSTYRVCEGSGTAEDPTCSDSQTNLSIADHLLYLGIKTGCGAPTTFTDEKEDNDRLRRMNLAELRKRMSQKNGKK